MSRTTPMIAGQCIVITEQVSPERSTDGRFYRPYASVRILQPSSGGGDEPYVPPSDVYMNLAPVDLQNLAAYFSDLARKVLEIKA